MSGIPEFRRVREPGPSLPPIRRAAGIMGLVAGVLMMVGYLLLGVAEFGLIAILFIGGEARPEFVMLAASAAVTGVLAIIIGIYALIAGVRGRRSHPGPAASTLVGFWATFLLIIYAFAMTTYALLGATIKAYTPLIIGAVGSVLVMIAVALVKPGASFGAWVTGSSLGLAGIVLLIISNHLTRKAAWAITPPEANIGEIATLTCTPILIGGAIAAAAVLIAPFIGAARAWISEIIAAIGAIIAAGALAYISITSIGPTYQIYEQASYALTEEADIIKLIGITGTAALALIATAAIIGIIALTFAIIHLATTHKKQTTTQPPPQPDPLRKLR